MQDIKPGPKLGYDYMSLAMEYLGLQVPVFCKLFGSSVPSPSSGSRGCRRAASQDSIKKYGRVLVAHCAGVYRDAMAAMASILLPVWGVSSDPAAVMRQYTPAGMDAQMGKNPQPIPGNLLWPRPSGFTHGRHTIAVHPDITYSVSMLSPRLERAFEQYKHLTFSAGYNIPGSATHPDMMYLQHAHVHLVHGDEVAMVAGADESYTLAFPADSPHVIINATTPFGAIRALETFVQLVKPFGAPMPSCAHVTPHEHAPVTYVIEAAPWRIADAPRYTHRA
ncbi:beta-N-acetylhexosaminidase [Synchytrium endobioticum]|uniref:Beta-N-acetylhexosaminidase n=1 Tax=Synchytrium endobioticum TaxID=286115 RepID=A0A507BTS1_9FUNG|nr:beta-N-acetylhexosaminidase [Synchytrium endobioticum]